MSGHTKGPWVVRTKTCVGGVAPCVDYDHEAAGGQVASLALCENADANARLIAAAPELLEIVNLYRLAVGNTGYSVDRELAQHLFEKSSAAILKATGESSLRRDEK